MAMAMAMAGTAAGAGAGAEEAPIDAQFNRAVDIVHRLPKSGPVQTSYEEKLQLYSLYKQATEGDITTPRPGLLDLLGRAKWDSWNKQKGVSKAEAKRQYVSALVKIFKRFEDGNDEARCHILELEGFGNGNEIARAASPASSTSSYHSSQASPPSPEPSSPSHFPPPDPNLPAPDVAPNIIPPSALNSSHRSLANLASSPAALSQPGGISGLPHQLTDHLPFSSAAPSHFAAPSGGSRTHSLAGGRAGSNDFRPSIQSLPPSRRGLTGVGSGTALGFVSEQNRQHLHIAPTPSTHIYSSPIPRDYGTPEIGQSTSPYLGIHQPTPIYPNRPASTSTFSQAPLSLPVTLQQIQTSLSALHERMSTLERTQALILRRDDRRSTWFWTSREEDDLEEAEYQAERDRWRPMSTTATTPATMTRVRRGGRRNSLTLRVIWILLNAVRRAMVDLGVGIMVAMVGVIVLGGGWRKARGTLARLRSGLRRLLE